MAPRARSGVPMLRDASTNGGWFSRTNLSRGSAAQKLGSSNLEGRLPSPVDLKSRGESPVAGYGSPSGTPDGTQA